MVEIEKLISSFELSPTIMADIKSKYRALNKFLEENGFELRIFPQGSIAYGTAIRPYSEDNKKEYDLDIVCCIEINRETSPSTIRENITRILNSSEIYAKRLDINEECITITYSGVEGFTFKIDILVARKSSTYQDPSNLLIEFAYYDKLGKSYKWKITGAEEFIKYFEKKNKRFLDVAQNNYIMREKLHSVVEIPEFIVKSNLQKAIQIIKRLRDVYYASIQSSDRISSHFITFAFLDLTSKLDDNASIFEMINAFINNVITFINKDGECVSLDPVTQENMVNIDDYEKFSLWIAHLSNEIVEIFHALDNINDASIERLVNNFGKQSTMSIYTISSNTTVVSKAKPWGNYEGC